MDVTELVTWFAEDPTDPHRLRSLGSSLGVELSRRRLEHLAAVMQTLARVGHGGGALAAARASASSREPSFQAGYLTAVEDVVRAFQAELGEEESERELVHYARTEPYRGVLLAMGSGAETSTEIAAAMGKHKSSASRALSALRAAGLVASYSAPDGNERLRPHALTLRGQRVLAELRARRDAGARSPVASGSSDKVAARKKT
ncbi:MAG TPA: helix-turn-helix domain-containing protein, partial [Kofleriaceae bacterium]|nr:helix-turn-helix domain-containing protein [Kofleriaceae bacterium]